MTATELTHESLFDQGMARLAELLGPSWQLTPRTDGKNARPGGDALVTVHAEGEGSYGQLLVDVKLAGVSPRTVEEVLLAKLDLLRQLNHYTTLLVITPWLSRQSQKLLRSHGISYLDLMGNVSLRVPRPAIVIHTEGAARAPQDMPRQSPSRTTLAGPKAGRLVRLLTDVRPPYRAGELARASGLSLGYVSRLLDTLEDQLLIRRDGRVITTVDWPDLLRARAEKETLLRKGSYTGLLAPNGIAALIRRIRELPASRLADVAVTGTHAAHTVAPLSAGGQFMLYVSPRVDEDELADDLGLLPVHENADTLLLTARDPSVLARTRLVGQVPHVALSQTALDCLAGPGRMPAEGEAVIEYMKGHQDHWQISGIHDLPAHPRI
ncbi:helix-turn-helix domain-containing protein [Streptomyces californicus]|uniref:helix-turn-helix domain-containing protein n=1 Tax=Streptomyces californicus TaxID=67351 RepID=UPI00368686E8